MIDIILLTLLISIGSAPDGTQLSSSQLITVNSKKFGRNLVQSFSNQRDEKCLGEPELYQVIYHAPIDKSDALQKVSTLEKNGGIIFMNMTLPTQS